MMRSILLFADRLPPLMGGMEVHAKYFIDYFTAHPRFPLAAIVTKDPENRDVLVTSENMNIISLDSLPKMVQPSCLFFNSGRWIEELEDLRQWFPQSTFIYRTGGNEILKAPLVRRSIPGHLSRQKYWSETLNRTIDYIITNSNYTETRLRNTGIECPFFRCVGGVNWAALKPRSPSQHDAITIFCAARFVPYKNHALLLAVIHQLHLRGYQLRLKLAGEGPLLGQIQELASLLGIESIVSFLGTIDHELTCSEIAEANFYMLLSMDFLTEVPGGSYVHAECMGRSLLEALSAGTYVIAGRGGAVEEVVTAGRGTLVELTHPVDIADHIEHLFRTLPGKLPRNDTYSWERIFKQYEALLEHKHASLTSH